MAQNFLKLLRSKRAVNSVISNIILIAAVIVVGFAMLSWAQSQSTAYNNQYSNAVQSDTAQLRERVVFEYVHYDTAGLKVFLMNSGTIGGVTIANVYVDNATYGPQQLYLLNDMAIHSLNVTQEGYFMIDTFSNTGLAEIDQSINHQIKIVTGRGSIFVSTFSAV